MKGRVFLGYLFILMSFIVLSLPAMDVGRFERIDVEESYRSIGRDSYRECIYLDDVRDSLELNIDIFEICMELGLERINDSDYFGRYAYVVEDEVHLKVSYEVSKSGRPFHSFQQKLWMERR